MGRPRKYDSLYGRHEAYFKTEKGKEAVKRYQRSEKRKTIAREWARKHRGTIVDKQQWFIDTYGDIETALALLNPEQRTAIELYYGLNGNPSMTQAAIAEKLGKYQPEISRINKDALKALEHLKKANEDEED